MSRAPREPRKTEVAFKQAFEGQNFSIFAQAAMSSTFTKKSVVEKRFPSQTTKKASITPIYAVEVMKGKKVFKIDKSPTKKFIESFRDDFEEFNINKMLQWDSKNVLMYTRYVHKNFEDPSVLMNIMMMDR